ncbi:DUF899 family protein [Amycolatopsis vastitatis]|uniref:DUF899 family protein n=1 Tax=Amycolatopsis vastitatis TaxID=1905142 RepID=UPI001F0B534F|nr:DUF899 family protein [Amycolatopsis vastitatis]
MTGLALPEATRPPLPRPRAVPAEAYRFTGPAGGVDLAGLFGGHRRLAVHHPLPDRSRPGATVTPGELSAAMHAAGTRLVLVSHAPYAKLEQYGVHFGWDLPAYSAVGTAFGSDFPATRYLDGSGCDDREDAPGLSFFRMDGGFVRHLGSVAVPYLDFLGLAGVTGHLRVR